MRLLLPCCLFASSWLSAAESGDAPTYLRHRDVALSLTNVDDPARVASAALFVTADGGQTWTLAQEVPAPADHKTFPRFAITLPGEGTFGLASRTVFTTGQREADPQANTPPLVTLVVDTTAPVFTTAKLELVGQSAGLARVHARWAANDAHLGDQPVAIEIAGGDGHFAPAEHGAASGDLEASIPVGAITTLRVRFVATDLAGNVTRSEPVTWMLAPPKLDEASRQALAAAVETLPAIGDAPRAAPTVVTVAKPAPMVAKPAPTAAAVDDGETVPMPPTIKTGDANADAASTVPLPPTVVAPPAAKPVPVPEPPPIVDGRRPAPATLPFASGEAADELIKDARVSAQFGRIDEALDFYGRALSSSRAGDAVREATRLLVKHQRPLDLCTFLSAASSEFIDDQTHLVHGRILVTLGRHDEAERTLTAIGSRSNEAREARLLIATCWQATGRAADARALLIKLSQGSDGIAEQARRALAGR